jgi:hypothetical protein
LEGSDSVFSSDSVFGALDSFLDIDSLFGALDSFLDIDSVFGALDSFLDIDSLFDPEDASEFQLLTEKNDPILYLSDLNLYEERTQAISALKIVLTTGAVLRVYTATAFNFRKTLNAPYASTAFANAL